MIIDHVGFAVRDPDRTKAFGSGEFAQPGIMITMEVERAVGMGRGPMPEFRFDGNNLVSVCHAPEA